MVTWMVMRWVMWTDQRSQRETSVLLTVHLIDNLLFDILILHMYALSLLILVDSTYVMYSCFNHHSAT